MARFRCHLKLCVHWTWNQEGLQSDRTVQNAYTMHKKTEFSWHKCALLSLVYCNVHETCAERFLLHHSVAFCSPFIPGKKENKKHDKSDILSVISVHVCRNRPTKIRICVSQKYPKLRIMDKIGRFHDTPLQLVQNVHRFASCARGQVILNWSAHAARKRKT